MHAKIEIAPASQRFDMAWIRIVLLVQSLRCLADTAGETVVDECGLEHFGESGVHIHHTSSGDAEDTSTGKATLTNKQKRHTIVIACVDDTNKSPAHQIRVLTHKIGEGVSDKRKVNHHSVLENS